jgi:hypothetical protein
MSRLMKGSKSIGTWFTYGPRAQRACDACVWGRGSHMPDCPNSADPLPEPPLVPSVDTIRAGMALKLTTMAARWTRDVWFLVQSVEPWGVNLVPALGAAKFDAYRAAWFEIEPASVRQYLNQHFSPLTAQKTDSL